MSADVDAVIAALRVALDEALGSDATFWNVKAANRWVSKLPGFWLGRWRQLRLKSPYGNGECPRDEFVGHVRATIAFLETIDENQSWWRRVRPPPIDAEFREITSNEVRKLSKPDKPMRIIK